MEVKTKYTVEFRSLIKDNNYYTLDGSQQIDSNIYRKLVDESLSNLSNQEKLELINHNTIISDLTAKLRGYNNNLLG